MSVPLNSSDGHMQAECMYRRKCKHYAPTRCYALLWTTVIVIAVFIMRPFSNKQIIQVHTQYNLIYLTRVRSANIVGNLAESAWESCDCLERREKHGVGEMAISPHGVNALGILSLIMAQLDYVGLGRVGRRPVYVTHLRRERTTPVLSRSSRPELGVGGVSAL